ncbi:NAD-dependent epimerase/dehydratase family protein [Streptomyces sp. V4-01]|uniref:NAD-dependent epimerase/dehydratase family protein n=1 Tax=Actinacidiphila polyblastidii TaxID=3110430 RepID=A0ABU7PGA7_9ACTN|nr:NAD-dependent epimerase/dehydratase family protein [Streptomyces sp. V4-01]
MKYLVTGATGFIGARMVARLAAHGHDITALVRDRRHVPHARTVQGDLATGAGLSAAVRDADRVIHLAGLTKARTPRHFAEVNTEGTRRLCAAVAALPQPPRLVYCSSLAAAGPGRLRHEDDPPDPVSAYGRSKLGGERALRDAADRVPGVVVRPPIVYGPGDAEFLPRLVTAVRAGLLPAVGARGPRRYSLIHVDDLCQALLLAADSGAAGATYHVSDGTEHLWQDIGAAAAAAVGRRPPRLVHIPALVAMSTARTLGRASLLNPDKISELVHPDWTCAGGRLPFTPRILLHEGLESALGHRSGRP